MPEQYSEKQVEKILFEAMNNSGQESFSRTQLEDMASELDISSAALELAITSSMEEQLSSPEQSYTQSVFFRSAVSQSTVSQSSEPSLSVSVPSVNQVGFDIHFKVYCAVNTFLLLLNFTLAGTITWAIFPLLGWGLGVSLHSTSRTFNRSKH